MKMDVLVNKREFKAFVESETNEGNYYKIESDDVGDLTCSCKGFTHRFTCKHIKQVMKELNL
jgi:hypothetical protein